MLIHRRTMPAVFLVMALTSSLVLSQPHISGNLSGTLGPGIYIVDGDINVLYGTTLTIQPGTIFQHAGHFTWNINGTLVANGTQADSIRWIRQQPVSQHFWGGLRFTPTIPVQNSLDYCVLEDVYNTAVGPMGGGIYVVGNYLTLRHSRISGCRTVEEGAGIYAYYATMLLMENCIIDSCTADIGGGIYLNLSSGAQVKNCVITRNRSTGT